MNELLLTMVFGTVGGVTRACVGLLKYKTLPKQGKFKLGALLFTIIASGVIGLFAGLVVSTDNALSLLAGYAGTDFIESIYKIRKKQEITI
ncbi:MAG: hypothetical protein Q8N77_02130 [Nanoarchaeota archaeon]|nr:hypothetical protein [Nanoarchaeota archaeon]